MRQAGPASQDGLSWRTARSCNGGACIQVAPSGEMIVIGDTKNPRGPVLTYTQEEWAEFVIGVKQGDFDRL